MDVLKKKFRIDKLNLTRCKEAMSDLTKITLNIENLSKLESLLSEYRHRKEGFDKTLEQILMEIPEDDSYDATAKPFLKDANYADEILSTFESKVKVFQKKLSMADQRDSLLPNELDQSFRAPSTCKPKLEKIQVPTFDGQLLNFPSFKGLFVNLVHNNTELSNVQKLYYLKQALVGSAKDIIRDFELTDSAYPLAWSYVLERFENKRAVIRVLFKNLLNLKTISHDAQIRGLLDQVDVIVRGLKAVGEVVGDTFSRFIAYLVSTKLDVQTSKDWENSVTSCTSFPKLEDLKKFLQLRAFVADERATELGEGEKPKSHEKKSFAINKNSCIACKDSHLLIRCPVFNAKAPKQRLNLVQQNHLCSNCFSKGHSSKNCTSKYTCKSCKGRHHTMLHLTEKDVSSQPTSSAAPQSPMHLPLDSTQPSVSVNVFLKALDQKVVLLPTAVVNVLNHGTFKSARVLLDSCSQVSLISEDYVKRNRLLVSRSTSRYVQGVTTNSIKLDHSSSFSILSRYNQSEMFVTADIVPASVLSYKAEGLVVPKKTLQAFRQLNLADPAYYTSPVDISKVDILLGAEYYESCFLDDRTTLESLTLHNSKFGWVVSGPLLSPKLSTTPTNSISLPLFTFSTFEVERQLRKFWEIEEAKSSICRDLDDEKMSCVSHFEDTYSRLPNGQFVVQLPTRVPPPLLLDNRDTAFRNLCRTEQSRPVAIRDDYVKFMREYEELGHMTRVETANDSALSYYIPHQAVLRPSSTTTALRVVFNASFKTPTGNSLNDVLLTGPCVQPELFDTLLTFRQHRVAFTADIEKMYRQVIVHPKDRHLQRILWRENPLDPVQTFELNTVTYGTAPASFLATYCLVKLAATQTNPNVQNAIKNEFYMDDLLSGAATTEQAVELRTEIHRALSSAGFNLRKYQSNSPSLLKTIEAPLIADVSSKSLSEDKAVAVLGLNWFTESDSFRLKVREVRFDNVRITKRIILSEISKTFDPLGFTSPVTIRAKIFLQQLWKESLTWDQPISEELAAQFLTYWEEIAELEQFSVARPYTLFPVITSQELIAFCDASDKAYAVVTYMKCVDSSGAVSINLVAAKTRVAPLKQLTIPRLELEGASLLADLTLRIRCTLGITAQAVRAFSDSQVVLAWLAKPAENWKMFVANRVRKIQEAVSYSQWAYVNTRENPADLATRGLSVSMFLSSELWIQGPKFLRENFVPEIATVDTELERRKPKLQCLIVAEVGIAESINKISSYTRLIRTLAYVCRFVKLRKPDCSHPTILSAHELKCAEMIVISSVQRQFYAKEFDRLSKGKSLTKKSRLLSLHPFIDENKVLRVGGRLQNASVSYERKHPIILHAKMPFVLTLIRHLHYKFFHCGKMFLVSFLRAKFWVSGNLTNAIKGAIRSCVTCIRHEAATQQQLMGNLPAERVNVSRPFTHTGVDFAGPFVTKCVGHRSTIRFKSYAAVFVCFSTKALHLEVVSQLTTDAFLSTLSRFISRRGCPATIWSDNGTNFVGAAGYLKLSDPSIQNFASSNTISWRFNPPRAPHRGGIWESAVKSMKHHLVRSTNGKILTFEELATVLCRIESILNSRPIVSSSRATSEPPYLTPGHFLIGDSLLSEPEPVQPSIHFARHYEAYRQIIDSFWKTWRKDYLAQLQTRNKWQMGKPNLTPGTVVLVKDNLVAPGYWKHGIITEVYPDSENVVRTVDVRSESGVKRRASNSLIPLPTSIEFNQICARSESNNEPLVHPGGEC